MDRTKATAVQVESGLRTFKGSLITEVVEGWMVRVIGCSRGFVSIKLDIKCYKITRVSRRILHEFSTSNKVDI